MRASRFTAHSGWLLPAIIFCQLLTAQSQIIITNFAGVSYPDVSNLGTAGTPPDTMGAAGTNQFVEFVNGAFAVYTKAGVRQSLVADTTFWLNAGISSATMSAGLTDPRITYDVASARWFATEITVDATGNKVLVGRSDSSNPSGTWKALSFTANSGFGDYDTLGVDATGVYVAVNNFNASGAFTGVSFFSIPKTNLLAATPTLANMTRFDNLNANTYGFTLQGVNNADAGPGHGVMVAVDNSQLYRIDRTTINGSGAAGATLGTTVRFACKYDGNPLPATQPSSGQTIDAGDDRFSAAIRQVGGYIFMANTITNLQGGTLDAVHWLVLNETNNTIVGEGVISDSSFNYYQPSIAANHAGKILLTFNRSGPSAPSGDISIYAALGTLTNGTVTMGTPFVLKAGNVSNFSISFDSAPYRWGDYSATMFDPTDENLVWTIQEIPLSSTAWGTQISLISLATNPPALKLSRNGNTGVLAWPLSTDPAYALQANTNLLAANAWTALPNPPVISINQNLVTVPLTNGATFFRLKK